MLAIVIATFLFIIFLLIGSRAEKDRAERAADTSSNFILDPVCTFNPTQKELPLQTFPNAYDAHAAGWKIVHCGQCAFCSNMHDISIYVETQKLLQHLQSNVVQHLYLDPMINFSTVLKGKFTLVKIVQNAGQRT
jgi:hypothetical protein